MKEFNYKRAFDEWAKPHFDELIKTDELVRLAWQLVLKHAHDLVQGDTHDSLKISFDAISEGVLNEALVIIYCYGHWSYDNKGLDNTASAGAYWRFKNLAKAHLIRKNALEREIDVKARLNWPDHDFMDHKEGTGYNLGELNEMGAACMPNQDLFSFVKVFFNFKPHPFVIGMQHFPRDGGIYIQPDQAPCAMKGCYLDYAEHITEKIYLVRLLRNAATNKEAADVLALIKPFLVEHGFEGVAFINLNVPDQDAKPGYFNIPPPD